MRMCGNLAAACSFSKSRQRETVMAMFDWPEANHTSPTSTPLIRRMFSPVTFSPPVTVVSLIASNRTRQRPSSPATVRLVWQIPRSPFRPAWPCPTLAPQRPVAAPCNPKTPAPASPPPAPSTRTGPTNQSTFSCYFKLPFRPLGLHFAIFLTNCTPPSSAPALSRRDSFSDAVAFQTVELKCFSSMVFTNFWSDSRKNPPPR